MFYFFWALKNLYHNKKQTLEMILFIAIISMMFFLNLAFLKGSREQMEQTLESYIGDIALGVKSENYNLAKVKKELETGKNKNAVKMIVGEYSLGNARIISNNGYLSNAHVKGDRKSTRLNSSHTDISRMPSSA